MDSAITLPIVGRVGLDAVLDLIPVFGNFAGAAISLTLIARTLQYGPPPSLVSKMLSNVLVDVILGGIPLIGPLADIWFKANDRNAALMREFLASNLRALLCRGRRRFGRARPTAMSFQNSNALNTISCSPKVCQR